MGLFSPVKRHANKFRYIPRYYDPEKERREQRRRELHGTSTELDNAEYQPGQYIRTQREARRAARSTNEGKQKMPSMMLLMLSHILQTWNKGDVRGATLGLQSRIWPPMFLKCFSKEHLPTRCLQDFSGRW